MKKYIMGLITFVMLLFMATAASAMTQVEWNQQCRYKMAGQATLYDCFFTEPDDTATSTDLSYTFEAFGTLASGTYISVIGEEIQGKREIAYFSAAEGVQYGFVDVGQYVSATVKVTGTNGVKYTIPELCWQNPDAVRAVLGGKYSAEELQALIDGMMSSDKAEAGDSGRNFSAAVSIGNVTFLWTDESGEEQPVAMKRLGLVNSVIVLNGEEMTVPTSELKWEADVKPEQAMATIYAPKSGASSLRAKSSSKGKVITKCKTNRIVLVLKSGKNYSKVYYDGMVGYVLTSALRFYPVGGVQEAEAGDGASEIRSGWISFRGKLKSRNTINIRMNGKNGSRILGDYIAGTPVTVFSQSGKWSEIEVDGYRAFILSEYVTLDAEAE